MDFAVRSSMEAVSEWSLRVPIERSKLLNDWADRLYEYCDEIAEYEMLDVGKPLRDTTHIDVPESISCLRYFSRLAESVYERPINLP